MAFPKHDTFEFSLNYTKLATLAIKVYVGKSKINSAKNVTFIGHCTKPSYLRQVGFKVDHKRSQVQSTLEVTFLAKFILLFPT